jgi:hypothetical protein
MEELDNKLGYSQEFRVKHVETELRVL